MNKTCVYVHRRKDNNVVFYVGSGTISRSTHKSGRNKNWHSIVNLVGFYTQVLKQELTKNEAFELENQMMKIYPDLTNCLYSVGKTRDLDFNLFNKWFEVSTSSPTGLVYRKDNADNKFTNKKAKRTVGFLITKPCGRPAGWRITLKKKVYGAHRIIWLLTYGEISSDLVIDHIDRNPLNNNIDNLRLVSYQVNSRNCSMHHNSKTGTKGIQIRFVYNVKYYTTTWHQNGKLQSKYFNVNILGEETAKQLAIEYRELKTKHYSEYN